MVKYLSTDPNAGRDSAPKYLSTDPMAGTDEALISAANSKYTVNPDPSAWSRRGGAFVDRGMEMLEGMGSLGLDAAKSALTLEGQVGFLPRMAKNMYEGMVEGGAEAINRQTSPERKGLAAVPVVGPYVMNVVSDYEEGKGPEAEGRMAADALSTLIPGSKAGRAGAGIAARGAAKGAKAGAGLAVKAGKAVGPEVVAGLATEAITGGGGALAAVATHVLRPKVAEWLKKRFGMGADDAARTVAGMSDEALQKAAAEIPAVKPIPPGGGVIKPIPAPKPTAEQIKAAVEAGPRGNAAKRVMAEQRAASRPTPVQPADPVPVVPGPAPVAPRPSPVSDAAIDVDSALPSLPKATQARLQHVVKQAMKESTARLPQPDPSAVVAGRDPFKLGNRVYSSESTTPRTRISEHYAINPDIALAEGATGVHPTLGLPMRADGKVLVRNVEEFSENPGRAPRGAPVWRDPDARFGNNQTVNEVAAMLEARSSTSTSIADLQKQLEAATKREPAPGSYAADEAASAARQKQHIADSYAAKESKDAANVKQSESLIPDMQQSAELLKKYPKRGGESNVQWMKRVTESVKQAPSTAQDVADDLARRIIELSTKQGMSNMQIRDILRERHGIPNKHGSQMVNMVLASLKETKK